MVLTMLPALSELFYSQKMLELLRNTPGMRWTPAIPRQFENYTSAQIKGLLTAARIPAGYTAAGRVSSGHHTDVSSWSWLEQKPECFTVRDQGACGSCWAFSGVGSFTHNRCIQGVDKKMVQYSEQYLLSCDHKNNGCNGGVLDWGLLYIQQNGIATDECVPYTSGSSGNSGTCPTKCADGSDIALHRAIEFYTYENDAESIKAALAKNGTVSTQFMVYTDFMYYESGIYHHVEGFFTGGHSVLFVGYGEEDGTPYWLVKNSWGSGWGEDGYFRILRGTNECSIEQISFELRVKE